MVVQYWFARHCLHNREYIYIYIYIDQLFSIVHFLKYTTAVYIWRCFYVFVYYFDSCPSSISVNLLEESKNNQIISWLIQAFIDHFGVLKMPLNHRQMLICQYKVRFDITWNPNN